MYDYLEDNNVVILTSLILLVVFLVFGLTYTIGNEQENTQQPSIETFDVDGSIAGSLINVNTLNAKSIAIEPEIPSKIGSSPTTGITISNPKGFYLNLTAQYTAEENTITKDKVITLSSSQTNYSQELKDFIQINQTDSEAFNLGGEGTGVSPGDKKNLDFNLKVNASLHDTLSDAQNKQNEVDSSDTFLSTSYTVNDKDAHRLRVSPKLSNQVAAFRPSSSSYDFTSRPNSNNLSATGSLTGTDTVPLGHGAVDYTLAVDGIDEVAYGEFPSFGGPNIRAIESWGNENYTDLGGAYEGTTNFEDYNATDAPDLSQVSNLSEMFKNSNISASTSNLSNWNTSTITDMSEMFKGASNFNGNISGWNVSNISTASGMAGMFDGAGSFVGDLSDWCVSDIKSSPSRFAPFSGITGLQVPQFRQTCFDDTGLVIRINHTITNSVSTGVGGFKIITNPVLNKQGLYDYSVKARAVDGTSVIDFGGDITGNKTLSFPTGVNEPNLYDIQINGTFPGMFFPISFPNNIIQAQAQSEAVKIKSIEKWGQSQDIANATQMFAGAVNLEYYNATNSPQFNSNSRLGQVNATEMFRNADLFNGNIGNWDVSPVGTMNRMFQNASNFNNDISSWNTSNVQKMSRMFKDAFDFDQDISSWCVSQIPFSFSPIDFDKDAGFDGQPSLQPDWGTNNGCGRTISPLLP